MSNTSPIIPYELSKYLFLLLGLIGIFKYKINNLAALLMILCLIPSLFWDLSGRVVRQDLVFNLLGPINTGIAILLFSSHSISKSMLKKIIGVAILPLISVLCHSFFKAPDLDEVEFELGANMVTSGGFGSNQVSTGLGLASFFIFIFWINKWRFSGHKVFDTFLMVVFILQGLLTFSRGGMVTGFVGIVIVTYFLKRASPSQIVKYQLPKIGNYLLPALGLMIGVFYLVNVLTNGMLFLRYQGETSGTLSGGKEKDLNLITSGRLDILEGDLDLWLKSPVLGVGAGASKYLREKMNGVVAHVEFSRLLAEHGVLGAIYFGILVFLAFRLPRSNADPSIVAIVCAFYAVGVFTSFHAAMRTFVSPLTIGLSMVMVKSLVATKSKRMADNINQTLVQR
ncbi:O-antigen ligase-like membrane protein [Algoriphagus aquaeductus]|uniref:O-antigen ligase-like membrane protein n=1 Tax=Algoriphagus aquaeductus TaxID=475299 RepID=A0A326RKS7_9BACT|nr:O-antigen ligase family protein [Algoriphagus aquaeductus]PZV79131.1 O-antigen ligase-like membrane protein [Algoriphagus aquaeductus]